MKNLPTISLSKLDRADSGEIEKLYSVCDDHGFFYLSDHGIDPALVDRTIEASRQFFQLSESVKLDYRQDIQTVYPKTSRGYVPLYGEFLNQETGFDPKEIFDLGIERPPSDRPFTGQTVIPDDSIAPDFAASHYQLQTAIMGTIVPKLLKGLALALGLEPTWFDSYFTEPTLIQRTIYYPAGTGRAGKHTDNGIFTILIQEYFSEPSLRVHTHDAWIDAPCVEDAFVINLGDMLQLWTDGKFTSTPHEVIHRNSASSRISIPFFVYPNIDATIVPFGSTETVSSKDMMLKNFVSIWETHEGAGRAKELV